MAILFWIAAALIAYVYVVFPALVMLRGRLRPRPHLSSDITPTVSLVVVAHNEAASIGAKLENILSLDYPRDKLEVLIASDGSTDATEAIVRSHAGLGIRLLALPRCGKIPALNAAVAATHGEVLVFSDANSMYAPDAIRALVRPLADPRIGGVAGDQRYLADSDRTNQGERCYWNLDRQMKRSQSAAGSVTSATGAIYAIRRSLFGVVPPGVTDDFFISTGVVAQGYRLVFAPDAVAYEPVAKAAGLEFGRKSRVITRGLQGVLMRRGLLNPGRHGFYAIQLFSHKVLRRLVVFPVLLLLPASIALWPQGWVYQAAALAQGVLYGGAMVGLLFGGRRFGRFKAFSLPLFFCLVNTASFWATVNVLRGRKIDLWEPQRRETGSLAAQRAEPTAVSRQGSAT